MCKITKPLDLVLVWFKNSSIVPSFCFHHCVYLRHRILIGAGTYGPL